MSNKTIFKRIALTAVSALAAGSLAVISVPAANAAAADGDIDAILSVGLVGAVTPALTAHDDGSTTRTAVLLSTGSISVSQQATGVTIVSSGGLIRSQHGATTGDAANASSSINASQTCGITVAADYNVIVPTGAPGTTFTITTYSEDTCATAATISDVITVTIAASNLAGTVSAANSIVRWDTNNSGDAPTATEDAANASTTTGNTLELRVEVRDVYDQAITATTGALIVSVSSGAYLGAIAASSAAAPTSAATTQVSSANPSALWVYVGEATAGAGWSGTVTVSYNGVVIATKTGKITGVVTKLEGSALKVGKNNGSATTNGLGYQAYDAAGNVVVLTAATVVIDTSSNATLVADAVGTTDNSSSSAGLGSFTCANGASFVGTSDIVLKHTRSNGAVVRSAPIKVTCGGDATSYTASWDKATYNQGDIATLTVQFRDARGAVANSVGILTDATTADAAISANQMERVTALPATSATADANGQRKFTFTVGTSSGIVAGKYNAVVSFPTVNSRGTTAGVATGNASAAYEVVAPATISNAEVLASIVKLIAAINKQIRALQKQLRR